MIDITMYVISIVASLSCALKGACGYNINIIDD